LEASVAVLSEASVAVLSARKMSVPASCSEEKHSVARLCQRVLESPAKARRVLLATHSHGCVRTLCSLLYTHRSVRSRVLSADVVRVGG